MVAYTHPTQFVTVDADRLPEGLDPARHIVFSTMHGVFGEDGSMQRLLDAAGVQYTGCDAKGSDICFDKWRTRLSVSAQGVQVAPGRNFLATAKPTAASLHDRFWRASRAQAEPPG